MTTKKFSEWLSILQYILFIPDYHLFKRPNYIVKANFTEIVFEINSIYFHIGFKSGNNSLYKTNIKLNKIFFCNLINIIFSKSSSYK